MSRIRTVKPEYFTSEDIAEITDPWARLCFIGLWTHADDHGRFSDNIRLIKAALFALEDHITIGHVDTMLDTLVQLGKLTSYAADGRSYLAVTKWSHQRIDKPSPSKLPEPSPSNTRTARQSLRDTSKSPPGTLPEPSRLEGNREQGAGNRDHSPDPPEKFAADIVKWKGAPRDEDLWGALAHELGEAITETEKSIRGRTFKELTAANATPADVHERCAEYRRRMPDMALTDAALRKHWSSLAQAKVITPRQAPGTEALLRVARTLGVTGTEA